MSKPVPIRRSLLVNLLIVVPQAVEQFTGGLPADDDRTIIHVKRIESGECRH